MKTFVNIKKINGENVITKDFGNKSFKGIAYAFTWLEQEGFELVEGSLKHLPTYRKEGKDGNYFIAIIIKH